MFDFVFGIIIGFSLYSSIKAIIKKRKVGIIQLCLIGLTFGLYIYWSNKKFDFVFGGNNYEFFIQTAFVDKILTPYIIIILLICILIIDVLNIKK